MAVSYRIGIIGELQAEPLIELDRVMQVGHDHADDIKLWYGAIIARPSPGQLTARSGEVRERSGMLAQFAEQVSEEADGRCGSRLNG